MSSPTRVSNPNKPRLYMYNGRWWCGINPRTGKRVGAYHSWSAAGQCRFCYRWKSDFKPKPTPGETTMATKLIELTPGNIKTAMANVNATRPNGWAIDPAKIVVRNGYNVRVNNEAHQAKIRWLADQMKAHGYNRKFPLGVTVIKHGGKDVVVLDAGHRRLAAVLLAISEGAPIEEVPVIASPAGTSEEDLTFELYTSNETDKLSTYETALLCKRAAGFGRDSAYIAKRLGFSSAQYVDNLLLLAGAPLGIARMVEVESVTATTAIAALKKHGDKALDVLTKALAASAKGKVTAGGVADPRVKAIKKLAMPMHETLRALKKDPCYEMLSAEMRTTIETLLKVKTK